MSEESVAEGPLPRAFAMRRQPKQQRSQAVASRIEEEYSLPVRFEPSNFTSARWVSGAKAEVEKLVNINKQHIAHDSDGDLVFLTRLQWDIDRVARDYPALRLTATKEMMA